MSESLEQKKKRALRIIENFRRQDPNPKCALSHSNPMELLVATILSAQCTDKRVNMVTPALFKKYKTIKAFANANQKELEEIIHSTGFYKNKAKNIIAAAKEIMNRFGGKVPNRIEDLVSLPGVGRKTANVVLGNAYGIPGLTVDTHMIRINRLLGFTKHTDPIKIEQDLMKIVPEKDWTNYSHWIIHHGRTSCPAHKPNCPRCGIEGT